MTTKLFVGGLAYRAVEQDLRDMFERYGKVVEAKVVLDRDTGQSRGFAFVSFEHPEIAEVALEMDGQILLGRALQVRPAENQGPGGRVDRPRAPRRDPEAVRPKREEQLSACPPEVRVIPSSRRNEEIPVETKGRRRIVPPEHMFIERGLSHDAMSGLDEYDGGACGRAARDDGGDRPPGRR